MKKNQYIKNAIDILVDLHKSGSIDSDAEDIVKEAIQELINALKEQS